MNKILLFLLFCTTVTAEEYSVTERLFWPISTFDVTTQDKEICFASKRIFSHSTYDLTNYNLDLLATATPRFFAWGIIADVEDGEGNSLGSIEENLWVVLPWSEYKILTPENELAYIARMNFLGTEFNLFSPEAPDEILATIERPLIRIFRDSWTVKTPEDSTKIDPRFLILLAVYQTDKDNRARFWQDYRDALDLELEQYDTRRL